jgi:hypothetical protein
MLRPSGIGRSIDLPCHPYLLILQRAVGSDVHGSKVTRLGFTINEQIQPSPVTELWWVRAGDRGVLINQRETTPRYELLEAESMI